jgi:phosphatidylinositol glycan class N
MTLVTWVRLEHALYMYNKHPLSEPGQAHDSWSDTLSSPTTTTKTTVGGKTYEYRALTVADARVALFFFFLLQSAFFSTGNIASVSSFSLESVYRLIPVFNPFSQGALLILKLMVPFAVISANLGILNRRLEVPPSALFMVVMTISDIMTLNFFYMVRDEGSWLEIGTTISHFFIASLLCIFVAGLEFVSEMFISGVDLETTVALIEQTKKGITEATTSVKGSLNGSANKKSFQTRSGDAGRNSIRLANGVDSSL